MDTYRYNSSDRGFEDWPSEDLYLSQVKQLAMDNPNARVLDIGCGLGRVIEIVRPYIGSLIGLEPDTERFRACREEYRYRDDARILIVNSTSLEYKLANPADWFDIIIVSMVLQHVTRATCHQVLSDTRDLLRPDGKAIIATTHTLVERFSFEHDSTDRTAEEFDAYAMDTANQHSGIPVRLFSRVSFCRVIEDAGLAISEWCDFSLVPAEKVDWFSRLLKVSPEALQDMGISQYAIVGKGQEMTTTPHRATTAE